jgi:hypothetical protein
MEKETIEEAADLWATDTKNVHPADSFIAKQSFIKGAKWQAERMYSEEEVRNLFSKYQYDYAQWVLRMEDDINGQPMPTEWFEQLKKK